MTGRSLAVLVFVLGAYLPAYGQATVSLIDTAGDVGWDPSLAIAGGRGLVAYLGDARLKVAHCANVTCTSAVVSTVDPTQARYPALAVGTDGFGVVSYYDVTLDALKVAHCSNADCTSATITVVDARPVAGYTAIAIGSDGMPLVIYSRRNGANTELAAAHCSNLACTASTVAALRTLIDPLGQGQGFDAALAIGTDGRGLIAYVPIHDLPAPGADIAMGHCIDVACTALDPVAPATAPSRAPLVGQSSVHRPSLVIGADGKGLVSYAYRFVFALPFDKASYRLRHCADAACTSFTSDVSVPSLFHEATIAPLAVGADGKPWFVRPKNQKVRLARCDDAACETWTDSCALTPGGAGSLALTRGTDDEPLAAFQAVAERDLGAIHAFAPCVPSIVSVGDTTVTEYDSGTLRVIPLTLDTPPDTTPVSVDWATVPGTATAGSDFVPASGTATLGPFFQALVVIQGDTIDEPDEQFSIVLSNPRGLTLGDATGTVTIVDDDPEPEMRVGGCFATEGTGGPNTCALQVSLSQESGKPIEVPYATQDETATAGNDYGATAGTLSMAPGAVTAPLPITITGDSLVENDETFRVALGTPVNATLLESHAQGVILDDDAPSLSGIELTHGSRLTADLSAQPGPTPDVDYYRLAQPPLSSWEVLVDGVSGDLAPGLTVERLAADNSTVLQSGSTVGTGTALSLRFQNRLAATIVSQHLRVGSGACGTDCGGDDVYRVRLTETTARIPRFNNSHPQRTILLLQNTTAAPVVATIDFWDEGGQRVATRTTTLPARGLFVLDTSQDPGTSGITGSATITSDAPYGSLAGKAVAIEPGSGFSFDSPLEYRPR